MLWGEEREQATPPTCQLTTTVVLSTDVYTTLSLRGLSVATGSLICIVHFATWYPCSLTDIPFIVRTGTRVQWEHVQRGHNLQIYKRRKTLFVEVRFFFLLFPPNSSLSSFLNLCVAGKQKISSSINTNGKRHTTYPKVKWQPSCSAQNESRGGSWRTSLMISYGFSLQRQVGFSQKVE